MLKFCWAVACTSRLTSGWRMLKSCTVRALWSHAEVLLGNCMHLTPYQWVAHAEVLRQPDEGIIHSRVAVRVILPQHLWVNARGAHETEVWSGRGIRAFMCSPMHEAMKP